ncbi:MAG: hypothetical protein SNJ84_09345 [Verrucomicrobiia bacterium]
MKTSIVWLVVIGFGWLGLESSQGQWTLKQMGEGHELRLDRGLAGVYNLGSGAHGNWLTRSDAERRQWGDSAAFFFGESMSVFWRYEDYGWGEAAPSGFGKEMSGARNVAEMPFNFATFRQAGDLGLSEAGSRLVITHPEKPHAEMGYTFRLKNATGEAVKGFTTEVEVIYQGGPAYRDLPVVELQVSRDDATYERFAVWSPSEQTDGWGVHRVGGVLAEEVPPGGELFFRIYFGMGTGPEHGPTGWSRVVVTPLAEAPVGMEPRAAAAKVAARRGGEAAVAQTTEKVEGPVPMMEVAPVAPVEKVVAPVEVVMEEPQRFREEPRGSELAQVESVMNETLEGERVVAPPVERAVEPVAGEPGSGLIWLLVGAGVLALGLLGGCGYALVRNMGRGREGEVAG